MTDSIEKFIKIGKETQEWLPNQDTILPIDGRDIPNFEAWINWNGYAVDPSSGKKVHDGFDFAAYLTTDNHVVLGLPPLTPVRAVAEGTVKQILTSQTHLIPDSYGNLVNIEHGSHNSEMYSTYIHIVPEVKVGVEIKKGDIIGTLYMDQWRTEGRLVHLHLTLTNSWSIGGSDLREKDPRVISADLYRYNATPQGSASFKVTELPQLKIVVANFQRVRIRQ